MLAICYACTRAAAASPEPAAEERVRAVTTVRADPRTGRLVRVTEYRTPAGRRVPAARAVRPLIEQAARKHAVDPELVDAVIRVESGYNASAVSDKGAAGLMQLMPGTARLLGARDRFDPLENLEAGVRLLKQLRERYGDDRLALAAYNAGEGAVARHNGIPPYRETIEYLRKIESAYRPLPAGAAAQPAGAAGSSEVRQQEEPVRRLMVETDGEGRVYLRTR